MRTSIVTAEQVNTQFNARWGDVNTDETLLDLIRAEVTARVECQRWSSLSRLQRALPVASEITADHLRDLCRRLEYEGDITLSANGKLNASPVRAIRINESSQRIICSLPSERLRVFFNGQLAIDGVRRIHSFESSEETNAIEAVQALGGIVISAEAWAGLDLAPIANQRLLDQLDMRLKWESEAAGSHERDGAIEWQNLCLLPDGPRWRRDPAESTQLWRARLPFNRWVWVWTAVGETPAGSAFVSLRSNDANRAVFALARVAKKPVQIELTQNEQAVQFELAEWLPYEEYRYLSTLGSLSAVDKQLLWTIPISGVDDVLSLLQSRLGIECSEKTK